MRKFILVCFLALAFGCDALSASKEFKSQEPRRLFVVKKLKNSKDLFRAPGRCDLEVWYDNDSNELMIESISQSGSFEVQFYDEKEQLISFDYWDSSNGLYATLLSGDTCTIVLSSAESEYYIYL